MRNDELAIVRTDELAIERHVHQPLPTLRDIVAVLFRQRWPMLCAFILAIIAVAVSGLWIPKYEARMKILAVRERSDSIVTPAASTPSAYNNDQVTEEEINSEVELLNSEDLLRKVVLSAGLAETSGSLGNPENRAKISRAVRKLGKGLKIEPIRKSNVISVSYQASDPQKAEGVLKALAAAYMERHMEVHRPSNEFKFFDQQTNQYKQGLDQAQEKLLDFTKETGVVSAQAERDAALHQANDFDSTARQAQTSVFENEQRISALQSELQSIKPRITTTVRNADNPQLLEHLKSTLLDLELKRTDLLIKYQPSHPFVQEVDQQIAEAKRAINAEVSDPVRDETSDQNADYQWVLAELTKTNAELKGLKARAAGAAAAAASYHAQAQRLDQAMITQGNLLQATRTEEDNYLLNQRKREEALMSNALDRNGFLNVALAEQPIAPAIPKWSRLTISCLTLLLAGTFSLSTAFVLDFVDPTFRTPDELAGYLGAPVLGALPEGGD